jgi:hypothetical protein
VSAVRDRLPEWLPGRPGIALAALWGFAEGTLFFVVADVLFTRVAIVRPGRALAHLGAATLGAVAAGMLMFAWSSSDPEGARSAVAAVPKVGEAMIAETERRMDELGAVAMFDRPLGGVPYKVHAILAPEHFALPAFLLVTVGARLERFALSWAAYALLHVGWTRRLPDGSRVPGAIHALFWTLVYAYYWFLA